MAKAKMTYAERLKNTGRNDPCPCGSGKKYKKCHQAEDEAAEYKAAKKKEKEAAAAAAKKGDEAEGEEAVEKKKPEVKHTPFTGPAKLHMGGKGKPSNIPRRSAI